MNRLFGVAVALALAFAQAGTRAAPLPAANFRVEWRIQAAAARPAPGGAVVITSGSAATGTSGFGPGAVVVGTARAAPPQSLRVANGREGSVLFDRSETRTVYDMAWAGSASAGASAASGAHESGVRSHEVVMHRVDGLRVTPRWSHGDTLELDVALTHSGPAHAVDLHSIVRAGFDDWLTVATVGEGGDELQVRVSRR